MVARSSSTPPAGRWPSRRGRGDRVVAVAVTGQWASTVPVDEHGDPVGDCVMWMDTRGARPSRRSSAGRCRATTRVALARWVRRTGGVPSTSGDDPIGHLLHLEHDEPDVAGRARWYLEPVDYLTMRFTGVAGRLAHVDDGRVADRQPPARPCWPTTRPWCAARAWRPAKLPPLVASGSVIGPVQPSVAAELGISGGRPGGHRAARPAPADGRLRLRRAPTRPISRSARPRGSVARCRRRRPT